MSYEIAFSAHRGLLTPTVVSGTVGGRASGASFSPDGTKFAVITERVNGATELDRGIDIYTSSSSGWTQTQWVDQDFDAVVHQVEWYNNNEIWMSAVASSDPGGIYSVKVDSGQSSGWSATSTQIVSNGTTLSDQFGDFQFCPNKSKALIYDWDKLDVKIIESGSSWSSTVLTPVVDVSSEGHSFAGAENATLRRTKAVTWVSDTEFALALEFSDQRHGVDNIKGQVHIYTSSSLSGFSRTETESNPNVVALYYDARAKHLITFQGHYDSNGNKSDSNTSGAPPEKNDTKLLTFLSSSTNGYLNNVSSQALSMSPPGGSAYTNLLSVYGQYIVPDPNPGTSRIIFQTRNENNDPESGGADVYSTSKLYALEWDLLDVPSQNKWVLTELASGFGTDTDGFRPGISPSGEIVYNSGSSDSDDLNMLFSDGLGFNPKSACTVNENPVCTAVESNQRTIEHITASNHAASVESDRRYPNFGIPSPDGLTIAVATRHRNGNTGAVFNQLDIGIDFYQSGSTGWQVIDSVSTGANIASSCMQWRNNEELWFIDDQRNIHKTVSGSTGFSAPVVGADPEWFTANGTSGGSNIRNLRYFTFNEQKDMIFAQYTDQQQYAVFYSGSQTSPEGPGVWDGIVIQYGGSSAQTENFLTQIIPGRREGDIQYFYSSAKNFGPAASKGRVWISHIDTSLWPTPDANGDVTIGNKTINVTTGPSFSIFQQRVPPLESTFPGQTNDPTSFLRSGWQLSSVTPKENNDDSKLGQIGSIGKTYSWDKNFTGRHGNAIYWHSASNQLVVFCNDDSGQITSNFLGDTDEFEPNQQNQFVSINSFQNKILAFSSSSVGGHFGNVTEILPDVQKPAVSGYDILPAYDDKRAFFGIATMNSSNTNSYRNRIVCLESGSLGWKLTKISTPESTGGGPTQIGYANGTLVTNNPQIDHSIQREIGLDDRSDAIFTVETFSLSSPTPAGFTLTPSVLSIAEESTGTVSVVLNKQPSSDVVISMALEGTLSGRASLNKTTLTFTNENWNTQQDVTVTATSDNIDNGDATGDITFSIVDASSDDDFDSLADQTVALTVEDNDTAGLTFLPGTSLSTTEQGASTVLSISLSAQPEADVTVTCTEPDSTEGTMSPSTVSFTFTSLNWNTAQEITFTGIDDNEVDGNIQYTVTVSSTSSDSNFNNLSQVITITNVDSGRTEGDSGAERPLSAGGTGIPPNGSRRTIKTTKTQADMLPRKLHFEPSTIETIDKSVLNYMQGLDLFSNTNEGWKKVPVIWGTAERAYQVKHNKDIRDAQGMLKLPIISIRRVSVSKDMASKGVFQGNISEIQDEQGASVQVSRVIYQEKTTKFASADALRLYDQDNYPRPNPKVVYRTVMAPMPVNVTIMYEIVLRTEYQQQMNNLILPFVTNPGTINYIRLFEGEHRYEAFIQGDFQNADNLSDFSSDERKFETKIQLKVIGYLIGQEDNREKPHYAIRENAVEVKIPRERISLNEVPPHEFGAYYGLSGIKDPLLLSGFQAPFFFSNVPAVGSSTSQGSSAASGDASGNLVTTSNFSAVMAENLVVRETLKDKDDPLPSDSVTFTVSVATIANNTESLYLNGVLQEPGATKDYTISGNTIVFNETLQDDDSVFVTYIKT